MASSARARTQWEPRMIRPFRISRQFSPLLAINTVCPSEDTVVKPGMPCRTTRQKLAWGLLISAPMACQ